MKKSKKEIKRLKKQLKFGEPVHYLVIHNWISENNIFRNNLHIGDNVVCIGQRKYSDDFINSLLKIFENETFESLKKEIQKSPNEFLFYRNQNGDEGMLISTDIVTIKDEADMRTRIMKENPYIVKSEFNKWVKGRTFDPLERNSNGILVGSKRLKAQRKLYHYTKAQEAIVNSKSWRMSHYKYEDDDQEIEYTISLIEKIASSEKRSVKGLITGIRTILSQVYIMSLTTNFTKAAWNEYGSGDGVCFEFDEYELNSCLNDHLHVNAAGQTIDTFEESGINKFRILTIDDVVYDYDEQIELLSRLVKDYQEESSSDFRRDYPAMVYVGAIYALFFKSKEWMRQGEVRFVALQNSNNLNPMGYQTTQVYDSVPYIEFPIWGNFRSPVVAIHTKNKQSASTIYDQITKDTSSQIQQVNIPFGEIEF